MQDKLIKVLIADDEPLVRQGLKAMVDWQRYDMEVIADVPNGEAAWAAFLEHKPELIISDIVMPVMDGMELLKKVKHASPATKILFLSCHGDFQYAQEGIRLGVSGYLLKTSFNDQEIDVYLRRIQDEVRRSAVGDKGEDLASALIETDSLISAWLRDGDADGGKEWMRKQTDAHPFMNGSLTLLHLVGERASGVADGIQAELSKTSLYVRIDSGEFGLFFAFARELYPKCIWLLQGLQPREGELNWSIRDGLRGAEELLPAIRTLALRERYRKEYGLKAADCPDPIVAAIDYITARLHEAVSAADVADHVGLSRSYFSMQFKKSVGISFLEFLDKHRLEQAQSLLLSTEWRLQDIAERIGIPDSKYFSKWFRKETGLSPSEYRDRTKVHP